MVIIKKFLHTQRQVVKGKKAFVSVLAIVLSLLITISVVFVAIPAVSAKGESAFQDNECIFIDCRLNDGSYWDKDGAQIRVFTYYNNSDDENFCHEFEENFANDGWFTGQNVLQKGILADKFCDHVYRFRIPSDKLSHVRVVRANGNSTEKWNLSQYYMWDKDRDKTAGSKSNCIKITYWGNNGYSPAQWTCFSPTNNASYNSKTAVPDSTITGNSNLYPIDATFYDYYNDDEIQKGWQNINYESNHARVHFTKNNQWYWWAGYWEPFQYLNKKIASHDSGVNYPLYFGNFYGKSDGYTGEGASNLKNFNNKANNSNNIGGTHKSVAGLTGGTLDSDGDIVYATNNGYNSTTKVPFFDSSFLSSNKVGSVVNSKFPMRKETTNGVTTYYFDSTSGKDNVWLNNLNTNNPTVSYASNSKRANDSLYSYSNRETSGYGFFPFDGNRSGDIDAKNYGFGMRVDVKFNLGADSSDTIGQIKGTNGYVDQVFNFTGDDDVWVYVDGKLILDLGGDHKKASGTINFHSRTVSVDTGHTFNNATRNTSFSLDNYGDPSAEHTLTMFYVERGMIESNLSFNFNFAPVGNEFIVDKTVNTTNLNTGIQSAVAAADTFTFTQPTAAGKVSSKGTIGSDGKYTLKDGGRISFQDQFTRGQEFTVEETESSPLDYTTTWSAKDLVMNESRGSGSSKTANFSYNTSNTSDFAMTRVQLSYVNTPTVGNVAVTKTVADGTDDDLTREFDGTVTVSLDGGNTYAAYPLTYTSSDDPTQTSYTLSSSGALVSGAKLKHGRTLTFSSLPSGAIVKIEENFDSATAQLYTFTSAEGTGVTQSGNGGYYTVAADSTKTMTITNTPVPPGEIDGTITGTKYLDGYLYTSGTNFEYKLEGVAPFSGDSSDVKDTSSVNYSITATDANGKFTFSGADYGLRYTEPGIYRYVVTEAVRSLTTNHNGKDFEQETNSDATSGVIKYEKFLVVITVSKNTTTNKLEATTASRGYFTQYEDMIAGDDPGYVEPTPKPLTKDDFVITSDNAADIVFYNRQTTGTVTITKTDQENTPVKGVTFALYKIDTVIESVLDEMTSDESRYNYIKDNLTPYKTAVSNDSGEANFGDLPIFEVNASTGRYNYTSYQNYRVIEYSVPAGYNLNKTVPLYENTLEIKFPQKDGSNNWIYDLEFGYINGKMVNPYTGYFSPLALIRNIGFGIIGVALVLGAVYLLRRKKVFAKYKKKH